MIGKVNIGDRFLYLEVYNRVVRTFAFVEITKEDESIRYFQIKPLEVYFDDTYEMKEGQPVLGIKFGSSNFHTPKSINKIRNPYKKQTIRKLFGVR